ncbi:Smr/MutS family protein [Frigidibacter oleivorans]|uniref:Smr/MutS family protein n=1 Tax=Frigidibacter oleivorans TaxID=2487129 RepID=UPI000F8E0B11|nr:Smr/MutS family protein [Frigidibacter oleivorans]
MTRRRPRGLSPEERALWDRIAASAAPLHPRAAAEADPAPPLPPEVPRADPDAPREPPALPAFRIGQSATRLPPRIDLAPGPGERLAAQPVRMDRKAHRNLIRGKIEPEARIDLHGLTLAEAHPELIRFVLSSQERGRRMVLVITGKGRRGLDDGPIPQRRGLLRHQVPHWLQMPPLSHVVLQVTQAHLKHGGEGAFYVWLRRG